MDKLAQDKVKELMLSQVKPIIENRIAMQSMKERLATQEKLVEDLRDELEKAENKDQEEIEALLDLIELSGVKLNSESSMPTLHDVLRPPRYSTSREDSRFRNIVSSFGMEILRKLRERATCEETTDS